MKNLQVCHEWMYQTKKQMSGSNLFYCGTEIYSYNNSYLAAKIFPYINTVLINAVPYSKSTSRHLSLIKQAIPNTHKTFYVPCTSGDSHQENVKYFQSEFLRLLKSNKRDKVKQGNYLFGIINQLEDYCSTFRLNIGKDIIRNLHKHYQSFMANPAYVKTYTLAEKTRIKKECARFLRKEQKRAKENIIMFEEVDRIAKELNIIKE